MYKRAILLLALGLITYGGQSLLADQWSGSVEAHLDLDTPQYSRHETQTWTLTGSAPTIQGSIALYPAKWHYTGVGSSLGKSALNINWTVEANQDVQLAIFIRSSDNKLTFHQWTAPVYVADALAVTTQTNSTNGAPPVTTVTKYGLNQWTFSWIEDAPNKTNVSGSNPHLITLSPLPPVLGYNGSTSATTTCSWHFIQGPVVSKTTGLKSGVTTTIPAATTNLTVSPSKVSIDPTIKNVPNSTAAPAKNHYRITATHVLINHEENDDPYKPHGKVNEIFATSLAQVFDRRTNTLLSGGALLRTPIHGDINNSDPVKGIRVLAGSVSGSGGIQTGDDIHLLMTSAPSGGYAPFVTWEGDLTSGVELVVLRPMLWVVGGTDQYIYTPYTNRLLYFEVPTDMVRLPVIQSALSQSTTVSVSTSPQLVTTGNWNFHEVRPMGILMTTPNPDNIAVINTPDPTDQHSGITGTFPCTLSDQVIVLTREKIEGYLAGSPAKVIQVHAKGAWTVAEPFLPLGEYTLSLLIERL